MQKPLRDNTSSQETDTHDSGENRTRNPSKRAAVDRAVTETDCLLQLRNSFLGTMLVCYVT